MRIRKLKAAFGGLRGAELELREGLNVLQAGNEAGKSTWSRFIRAMFYGISTAERARQGFLPDRLRYLPWSGEPMEGRMDLLWREQELTVTRTAPSAGKPFGLPRVVYADTGEQLTALQGADAGERLLGITEAVYRRSAFLSGSELRVDPDRDLEKRMVNLVTSGEEQSSGKEAEERLRRWQRKRRWRNSGSIPETETRLGEKKKALDRLEEETKRLSRLRDDRDRLEQNQADLRLELRLHRRDELLDRRRRWAAADREAREMGERSEELERRRAGRSRETADALRAASLRLREAEKDRDAVAAVLEEAKTEAAALPEPEKVPRLPGRGSGIALIVIGLLLCAIGALALLHILPPVLPDWAAYILIALILLLVPGILRLRSVGKREEEQRQERRLARERAEARVKELERQLGADEEETAECLAALEDVKKTALCAAGEDPMEAADRLDALILELEKCRSGAEAAARLAETLSADLEEPEVLEGETCMRREEAERRLNETEQALRETERALAREEGLSGLLGDPLVLSTEAAALRESILKQEAELSALDLAEQALTEALKQMQSRFAPLIGHEAGELFRKLTGGRYTGVYFDRDLRFSVQSADSLEPKAMEYLSEGTKNQLYLAVRLAICRLALPGEDPCPLVLDDVLLTFDDDRARQALEALLELSRERQILLFTCTGRERELLRQLGKEELCLPL